MAAPIAPVHFELPKDHPGFSDPAYRARRARIAQIGATYRRGDPIPDVTYTAEEDEVWRIVSTELAVKHRRYACAEYLAGADRLRLPAARVPQLREVDERVHGVTGFRINPVPGLVPTRSFYGSLAMRTFLSTQYIRHHSVPFYTPEPDILHEIIGHANMLANPVYADLYQVAGQASLRATTDRDGRAGLRHHPVPAGALRRHIVRSHARQPPRVLRLLRPLTEFSALRGSQRGYIPR